MSSARIEERTKKLILRLKAKLIEETGQNVTSDDAIFSAVKVALDDFEKRKKQLRLNIK